MKQELNKEKIVQPEQGKQDVSNGVMGLGSPSPQGEKMVSPAIAEGPHPTHNGLVLAVVAPMGASKVMLRRTVSTYCRDRGLLEIRCKVTELIEDHELALEVPVKEDSYGRKKRLIKAGNEMRGIWPDILALLSIQKLVSHRTEHRDSLCEGDSSLEAPSSSGKPYIALIDSLKHSSEVERLRSTYGSNFYLIALYSHRNSRLDSLVKKGGMERSAAEELMGIDECQDGDATQDTRAVFQQADVFIDTTSDRLQERSQIARFLDLALGHPYHTPTVDEYGMSLAYIASLRSCDLSRQVGASVMNSRGDLLGLGCNDVPQSGGGLYWPGDNDMRDHALGEEGNQAQRKTIARSLARSLEEAGLIATEDATRALGVISKDRQLSSITEYGRAVHAEMEALLCAARTGSSPLQATLFSTTFPCHNCAKHIVASGVSRVVFIEPYPKSMAGDMYEDSVSLGGELEKGRVTFTAFVGIAPRKYEALFGLKSGHSRKVRKGRDGKTMDPRDNLKLVGPETESHVEDTEAWALKVLAELMDESLKSEEKQAKV